MGDITVKTTGTEVSAPQKKQPKKAEKKEAPKKDFYTETPFRKLGFLDEIGASLRPILSTSSNSIVRQLPNFAYIPATAYVLADVADKYQKGLDGTGEKPSTKMAVREACYQGIVSIIAPMGIVKGVSKLTKAVGDKLPDAPKCVKGAAKFIRKNKHIDKFLSKAGMTGKIAAAAISIVAVTKLSKPVDKITGTFFKKVVDPMIGVKQEKTNSK